MQAPGQAADPQVGGAKRQIFLDCHFFLGVGGSLIFFFSEFALHDH